MYTYVVQEYKVSNELLTEDIYVRLSHVFAIQPFRRMGLRMVTG